MLKPFDEVREQLERQYVEARYEPASGLSRDELVAEFECHRAENPDEPRIMTRAWLFHLLCSKARIAVEPDDYFADKLEHHTCWSSCVKNGGGRRKPGSSRTIHRPLGAHGWPY